MPIKSISPLAKTFGFIWVYVLLTLQGSSLDFGSPPQQIYSINQTDLTEFWTGIRLEDGRMLFAGEGDGVAIFDGWNWKTVKIEGLRAVRSMCKGENSRIWVGSSEDFGYIDINNDVFIYKSLSRELIEQNEKVQIIYLTYSLNRDGAIFFGDNKAYINTTKGTKTYTFKGNKKIHPFKIDDDIYCQQDAVLYQWKGDTFHCIINDIGIDNLQIYLGWRNEASEVFIATRTGIFALKENLISPFRNYADIGLPEILPTRPSHSKNHLILPTTNEGLFSINTSNYRARDLTPRYFVDLKTIDHTVMEDDNFLWVVTRYNLIRIQTTERLGIIHFSLYYPFTELWDSTSNDRHFYFSSKDGVFEMSLYSPTLKNTPAKIFQNIVYGLSNYQNNLYLTTPWDVMSIREGEDPEEVLDDVVSISTSIENDNALWVTTSYDVRYVTKVEGKWQESHHLSGFTGAAVQTTTDPEGARWVATNTGDIVRYLDPDKTQVSFNQIPSISETPFKATSQRVGLFNLDHKPCIIEAKGLYQWENSNRFSPIELHFQEVSEPSNWEWVVPLHFPEKGPIWLLRKHQQYGGYEIGKLEVDNEGHHSWNSRTIGNLDFLGIIQKIHSFEDENGNEIIAITGADGINFLDLELLPPVEKPSTPRLKFTSAPPRRAASRFEDPAFQEGKEIVPAFEYYIPHFRANEPMYFQTRLAGLEENWSEANTQTSRSFPGLRSGHYTLLVRTLNGQGETSPVTSIAFQVLPPWYRTTSAYVVYAIAFIYLGFLIFSIRLRESHKRQIELENKVKERTAELEKANRIKSDFVASMSHEIRNPMNGIIGHVRLLKPNQPIDGEILQSLTYSSGYLNRLVKNILDFSKIESDKLTITEDWFDPSSLRSTVRHLFRDMAGKNQISLIVGYYGPKRAHIFTDQSRIEQILVNLTSNAIRFTTHGSVRVGIHLQILDQTKATLKLWVKDTGSGIAKEDQERIFRPFEQGSSVSPMGTEEKGTGLGLAIVTDIVKTLGGTRGFESELGKGTSFKLSFPVEYRSLAELEPDSTGEKTIIRGRYLITDDIDYNLKLFRAFMQAWGARVDIAKNGTEAFQKLNDHAYDAIFLDWNLPDYTGPEIASMIRKDSFPLNTTAPIIAQTAYNTEEQKRICAQAGMNAYIVKPILPEKLLEKLLTVCPENVEKIIVDPSEMEISLEEAEHLSQNDINFETFYLTAEIHKLDLVTEIKNEVMHKVTQLCEVIQSAADKNEYETVGQAAHQIKNLVGNIRAYQTADYFRSMDHLVKQKDYPKLKSLLESLDFQLEHLHQLVDAYLNFEDEFGIEQKYKIPGV